MNWIVRCLAALSSSIKKIFYISTSIKKIFHISTSIKESFQLIHIYKENFFTSTSLKMIFVCKLYNEDFESALVVVLKQGT